MSAPGSPRRVFLRLPILAGHGRAQDIEGVDNHDLELGV